MQFVVDGTAGTGKSTFAAALRARGFDVADQGLPTRMGDDETLEETNTGTCYLILDADAATYHRALVVAGKQSAESHLATERLARSAERFRAVARRLRRCALIDARGTWEQVRTAAMVQILEWGIAAQRSAELMDKAPISGSGPSHSTANLPARSWEVMALVRGPIGVGVIIGAPL